MRADAVSGDARIRSLADGIGGESSSRFLDAVPLGPQPRVDDGVSDSERQRRERGVLEFRAGASVDDPEPVHAQVPGSFQVRSHDRQPLRVDARAEVAVQPRPVRVHDAHERRVGVELVRYLHAALQRLRLRRRHGDEGFASARDSLSRLTLEIAPHALISDARARLAPTPCLASPSARRQTRAGRRALDPSPPLRFARLLAAARACVRRSGRRRRERKAVAPATQPLERCEPRICRRARGKLLSEAGKNRGVLRWTAERKSAVCFRFKSPDSESTRLTGRSRVSPISRRSRLEAGDTSARHARAFRENSADTRASSVRRSRRPRIASRAHTARHTHGATRCLSRGRTRASTRAPRRARVLLSAASARFAPRASPRLASDGGGRPPRRRMARRAGPSARRTRPSSTRCWPSWARAPTRTSRTSSRRRASSSRCPSTSTPRGASRRSRARAIIQNPPPWTACAVGSWPPPRRRSARR